ncbi:MAG: hypothetical protein JWP29_4804 [Rhodoferax sp.]|nr:hypothetical protein [Rhodoferax sp.]
MDLFILAALIAFGVQMLKSREQRQRIALLGSHLGNYQIEKLMENLTQGYLRALGEHDAERSEQIWRLLRTTEVQLSEQFSRFANEFAQVPAEEAPVSRLPVAVPQAVRLFPDATFDVRKAFAIHAKGIAAAAEDNPGRSYKDKAFTMSAELFLMQHTCHWFCKSKTVASARMLARHQTAYDQLVASVTPATRRAYQALIEG